MSHTPGRVRRAAALVLTAGISASGCLVGAPAAFAAPAPTPEPSWFHDPMTREQRSREIAIPKNHRYYDGPLRWTKARYRTYAGDLAVPAAWAVGHQLKSTHALTFDGSSLFGFKSTKPSAATRELVHDLAKSFDPVTSIRCEGYADHAGRIGREIPISQARAAAICALIKKDQPGLVTRAGGHGGRHPVIVGGKDSQRGANRRVVVEVVSAVAAPSAPSLVDLVPGDESVSVTFGAPSSNGGGAVTGYEVSTNDGVTWFPVTTTGSGPYTAAIGGLTNGVGVTLRVRAVNAAGPGAPSAPWSTMPTAPVVIPSAPSLTNVEAGRNSVEVTFAEPAEHPELVTGYQISTSTTAHAGAWTDVDLDDLVDGSPYSVPVLDLDAGVPVDVQVRALFGEGGFVASGVKSATPYDVPGAPILTSSTGKDWNITTQFEAPTSDGGSPITGFEISYGGSWQAVPPNVYFNDGVYTVYGNGFDNGVTYDVSVRAVNAGGHGPASEVQQVTPITVPAAPVFKEVVSGDGTLKARFLDDDPNPARPVVGWEVRLDEGEWVAANGGESLTGVFSHVFEGLENGTPYDVTVRAMNAAGTSAPSETITQAPYTTPGAPLLNEAFAEGTDVTVDFIVPQSDGGAPITGYQVSYDDGDSWQTLEAAGSSVSTVGTVADVPAGVHVVKVRAVNDAGFGQASNGVSVEVASVTVAGAPSLTQVYVDPSGYVDFHFDAPSNAATSEITGYEFTRMDVPDTWHSMDEFFESSNGGTYGSGWDHNAFGESTTSFAIRAVGTAGPGTQSNTLAVNHGL